MVKGNQNKTRLVKQTEAHILVRLLFFCKPKDKLLADCGLCPRGKGEEKIMRGGVEEKEREMIIPSGSAGSFSPPSTGAAGSPPEGPAAAGAAPPPEPTEVSMSLTFFPSRACRRIIVRSATI